MTSLQAYGAVCAVVGYLLGVFIGYLCGRLHQQLIDRKGRRT